MTSNRLKKHLLRGSGVLVTLIFLYACSGGTISTGVEGDSALNGDHVVDLAISSKVPGDLPADASEADLARFAWNSFFALNWEASWGVTNDPNKGMRGTPSANWEFSSGGTGPDLTVWETYVHRLELTNSGASTSLPDYKTKSTIDDNGLTLGNYWNVLDEDNEIGSCYLFAYDEAQVMYMAKANIAEYTYLDTARHNSLDNILRVKNLQNTVIDKKGTKAGLNTVAYDSLVADYLGPLTTSAEPFCDNDTLLCLPCGQSETEGTYQEGAIEIKTAWRKLIPSKGDVASRFITRDVVVFEKKADGTGKAVKETFGLIGFHIIHKTHNYPSFIFASFEQVDVRDAQMTTIALNESTNGTPIVAPGTVNNVIDRAIPSTLQTVNTAAKSLITGTNSSSLLQYYQLIGVQGQPVDYTNKASDDNYFMANYVIESDTALTFFHGLFTDPFDASRSNVIDKNTTYNMGGCQGCHGRAQFSGEDFSFIAALSLVETDVDPYQTYSTAKAAAASGTAPVISKVMSKGDIEKLKKYLAEND